MTVPARLRELYSYWKTEDPQLAVAAMRAAQVRMRADIPALEARTMLREADATRPSTVMETYRHPDGIDASMQAHIEAMAVEAARRLMVGKRHSEVFFDP